MYLICKGSRSKGQMSRHSRVESMSIRNQTTFLMQHNLLSSFGLKVTKLYSWPLANLFEFLWQQGKHIKAPANSRRNLAVFEEKEKWPGYEKKFEIYAAHIYITNPRRHASRLIIIKYIILIWRLMWKCELRS